MPGPLFSALPEPAGSKFSIFSGITIITLLRYSMKEAHDDYGMEVDMARLMIREKKAASSQDFELSLDRITLGRAPDNVLVLNDKAASRHHAELRRSGGSWLLVDLGSSNGTWVEGEKVGTYELADGTVFLIGNTRLSFVEEAWDGRTVQMDMEEMAEAEPSVTPPPPVMPPVSAPAPPPQAPLPPQKPSPPPMSPPPPVAAPAPPPVAPHAPVPPQQIQQNPQPVRPPVMPAAAPGPPDFQPAPPNVGNKERAGFGIRLGAYLLDSLILGVIVTVLMIPLGIVIKVAVGKAPGLGIPLAVVSYLLVMVVCLAYILVPWAKSGATPGKKILHLKIVRDDGVEPLGYGKAILRMLGYFVSGFILYIGYLMILFNDEKKGLHDMIAGTHVIRV